MIFFLNNLKIIANNPFGIQRNYEKNLKFSREKKIKLILKG
jgi:hypothetical protein